AQPGAYKGFGFAGMGEPFPSAYQKPTAPRSYFPSPLDTYMPQAARAKMKDLRDGEISPSSPPMPVINNVFSLAPYRDYLEGTEGSAQAPFCREHLQGDTLPQNKGDPGSQGGSPSGLPASEDIVLDLSLKKRLVKAGETQGPVGGTEGTWEGEGVEVKKEGPGEKGRVGEGAKPQALPVLLKVLPRAAAGSTSALQGTHPAPQQPPLPEASHAVGEEGVSPRQSETPAEQYFITLHASLCDVISCSVSRSSPELLQEWLGQDVAALLANLLSQLKTFVFTCKCPFPHVVRAGAIFIPIHVVKEKLFPKLPGASVDQVLQEHKVELRPTTLSEERHLRDLELKTCTSRMLKLLALKQLPDIYPDL
ncbi:PREDICTED: LOW QUALITY PROTEIN: uncharacterized protein C15orf39 homolog, partial [Mesitornis unicolor]|uniref:LOW QUALITY PROTEIN: uncharacterized protein C15orf39 homolog n=1 Tax=Mesitornis unicolor TaxID=54374 RepID=UPI000528933C